MVLEGRASRFHWGPANGWNRRNLGVGARVDEGPETTLLGHSASAPGTGGGCDRASFFGHNGSPPLNPIGTLTPTANSGKRKIDCHERGCYPRFSSRGAGGWRRNG
jgi:hypothetical protein